MPHELIDEAERLVAAELNYTNEAGGQTNLHPMVEQLLPLSNNRVRPALLHEIERYEDEDDNEDMNMNDYDSIHKQPRGIISGGIDLSRYAEFAGSDDNSINYNSMYATLSYAMIQDRNLDLLQQNESSLRSLQEHAISGVQNQCEEYLVNLTRKRKTIDDINSERKRKQESGFKPVNDYLNERWKEGLKSAVDMSVEAARIQHSSH